MSQKDSRIHDASHAVDGAVRVATSVSVCCVDPGSTSLVTRNVLILAEAASACVGGAVGALVELKEMVA